MKCETVLPGLSAAPQRTSAQSDLKLVTYRWSGTLHPAKQSTGTCMGSMRSWKLTILYICLREPRLHLCDRTGHAHLGHRYGDLWPRSRSIQKIVRAGVCRKTHIRRQLRFARHAESRSAESQPPHIQATILAVADHQVAVRLDVEHHAGPVVPELRPVQLLAIARTVLERGRRCVNGRKGDIPRSGTSAPFAEQPA
jgi:hypothetical protein